MENLFEKQGVNTTIDRLNNLTPQTERKWGKMTPAQMLAHCNVAYSLVYNADEYMHEKPKGFKKLILKLLVKGIVVGEKPYSKNGRTAPEFLINSAKDFETEKAKMIENLNKTYELGAAHFEGKESHSFGKLTQKEWNNLFAKHIDHHLQQFGV